MKHHEFIISSLILLSALCGGPVLWQGCGNAEPAVAQEKTETVAKPLEPDLVAYTFDTTVSEGNINKYRIQAQEAHYYIPLNRIKLFELRVSVYDKQENTKIIQTVDSTEGIYYLTDSYYKDEVRLKQDIDLIADTENPIIMTKGEAEVYEALHAYYNVLSNTFSSNEYVAQVFANGNRLWFSKGFVYELPAESVQTGKITLKGSNTPPAFARQKNAPRPQPKAPNPAPEKADTDNPPNIKKPSQLMKIPPLPPE